MLRSLEGKSKFWFGVGWLVGGLGLILVDLTWFEFG